MPAPRIDPRIDEIERHLQQLGYDVIYSSDVIYLERGGVVIPQDKMDMDTLTLASELWELVYGEKPDDGLFSGSCLACGESVSDDRTLCAECGSTLCGEAQ